MFNINPENVMVLTLATVMGIMVLGLCAYGAYLIRRMK